MAVEITIHHQDGRVSQALVLDEGRFPVELRRRGLNRRGIYVFGSGHRTDWERPLIGPARGRVCIPITEKAELIPGLTPEGYTISLRRLTIQKEDQ